MNSYPRETVEYVHLDEVTVNGVPVTDFEVSVVEQHERPTVWAAPVELADGQLAFKIQGLARGEYVAYVRVEPDAEQSIVVAAGRFEIT